MTPEDSLHKWGHGATKRAQRMTRERERELIQAWRAKRDPGARDLLVRANLGCVMKHAHRVRRGARRVPLEDIVAVGCEGLLTAIDRFDPSRENRFVAFFDQWVLGAMTRFVEREERGGTPDDEGDPIHLAACVADDEPTPEDDATTTESADAAKAKLRVAMRKLTPKERTVIKNRLRSFDENIRPTKISMRELGVSSRRVEAIEFSAKAKLRRALRPAGGE